MPFSVLPSVPWPCLCGAMLRYAFAGLLCAMQLRCCAVLSYSSAMHHTAMPRPSCSSLSYATAELIPALLLLWISAPCVLCLSSAIPSSSMLLLCGRSVAILCLGKSELCLAVPLPCSSLPRHAVPLQCVSLPFPALPSPRESSQCLAIAPLVVSDQRRAFAAHS